MPLPPARYRDRDNALHQGTRPRLTAVGWDNLPEWTRCAQCGADFPKGTGDGPYCCANHRRVYETNWARRLYEQVTNHIREAGSNSEVRVRRQG